MRGSIFDYVGNLDTLIAVIVGACLAIGGALIAEIVQDRLGRRRRERDAARFFGEIISSIDQIFDLAAGSMKIGERWGSFTMSVYSVILHETETYFRNRERLFDIRDMRLRFAIHGHILRVSAPLASILDVTKSLEELSTRLEEDDALSPRAVDSLKARIERLTEFREGGYEGLTEQREVSASILAELEQIARAKFDGHY
ncbi:MAG: hypothetical protein RLN72_04295 [Henriciella sp.]